jgi:hypothetical protein
LLAPCAHEVWVALELDGAWAHHAAFTLRVSAPASVCPLRSSAFALPTVLSEPCHPQHPANFFVHLVGPGDDPAMLPLPDTLAALVNTPARTLYARVQALHTGVTPRTPDAATHAPPDVPFVLTLEPLLAGVVPASMLPVGAAIVVAAALAAWAASVFAMPMLERLAEGARRDVRDMGRKKE